MIDDRAKFEALTNALEEARNGLLWYQDRYPEAVDGSDDEAMARINAALASAQAASAEPVARMPPLLNANDLSTNFCAKWSGAQKVEAGDILDWIMQQPLYTTPAPAVAPAAVTDEQIEAAVRPLYANDAAAKMGLADDIRTARAVLAITRTPEPQAERNATLEQK